jgi:hypothetical protein
VAQDNFQASYQLVVKIVAFKIRQLSTSRLWGYINSASIWVGPLLATACTSLRLTAEGEGGQLSDCHLYHPGLKTGGLTGRCLRLAAWISSAGWLAAWWEVLIEMALAASSLAF